MSPPPKDQFYIGTILGSLFALLIFALLTGIGIRLIPKRVGWAATILFGTMCVVAVFDLVREISAEQDKIPDIKSQLSIRRALIAIGVIVVALFLGIADEFISFLFTNSFPRAGVWLGTFVTTLAFYPLREEKYATFKRWTLVCALLGVLSVIFSYGKDLLVKVLI
ncbi:MAG TPA: hypothetical protein VN724_16665 [Pyrinomonadaceae bacterium]|jgi:predicted membrane protein|nr:hypothetical protein [Pyrinomonadaceae bacterium]